MKRSLFLFLSVILPALTISGQTLRQDVISSAGGSKVNANISVSWTLGETIIPAFRSSDNNLILTGSFLQSLIVTAIREPIDIPVRITVYPNPAAEDVNVRFEGPADSRVRIDLIDAQGKLVKTGVLEQGESEKQIRLQDLSQGLYYLKLYKGPVINVYKIVKTR